jgi:hypothetical protein
MQGGSMMVMVDFYYIRSRKGPPPREEERNYSPYWKQQIEKSMFCFLSLIGKYYR